ncbi:MAG: hypothetical protein IT445_07195 [Phycisphaeraceae bacterium]|nr:hypothetical protein [Phycisphaeraceae bacterium]
MKHVNLLIYDDQRGCWGPLTDLRPIFDVRSGAVSNRTRIERTVGRSAAALSVPARLAAVMRRREPNQVINGEQYDGRWLVVNGRWNGLEEPPAGAVMELDGRKVPDLLAQPPEVESKNVIARPWHILDQLERTLADDLAAWTGARIAPTARVHASAVIDESLGPVVVDEHVVLEPLSVVQGPAYIGPHTVLRSFAHLRPHSAVGPYCRVGGEVSFSIFQGQSNKAHVGYLGHALVGQWVNLGAATTCSNLKNTYGRVRVQLSADLPAQDSGRIFLGPIVGDHSRLAIGTFIRTGAVIGTGSMIAQPGRFTPPHVPPFTFLTDVGPQSYDFDKFLTTARTAMDRRGITLDDAEADLLRCLSQSTV